MSYRAKEVVLLDVFSAWTEFYGKYTGCPFWSEAAWVLRENNEQWKKNVRHEHAVPKKVLKDLLLRGESPQMEDVGGYLDCFLIGAVVTIEEDKLLNKRFKSDMPQSFWDEVSLDDLFLRYKLCEIKIGKVTTCAVSEKIVRYGKSAFHKKFITKVRQIENWEPLPHAQVPISPVIPSDPRSP